MNQLFTGPTPPAQTLVVQQLSVARGDRILFSGLDFSVAAGEALHVQGRNGIGKTSMLETLCGLRRAESGQILPPPQAGEFHWLGHRNALNPALSPRENLEFWCGLNGASQETLPAALERTGMARATHRPCGQLSTGQKRRAALARLLVQSRAWWFLDEPLAGLDGDGLTLFNQLLQAHLAGGGAAVLTSHQPLTATTRQLALA